MKILVLFRNLRPIKGLEEWIIRVFHLQKKGRKLLGVAFALIGGLVGVSLLQLATLFMCGLDPHLWFRAMIPWLLIFGWALWRFFIRYLFPSSFICDWCERLKCLKHQSEEFHGKAKVCRECAKRRREFNNLIGNVQKNLDLLLGDLDFLRKHPK